jgi:hypothetical protein
MGLIDPPDGRRSMRFLDNLSVRRDRPRGREKLTQMGGEVHETTVAPPQRSPEPDDHLDLRLLRSRGGHGGLVLTVRVLPTALLLTALQLLITGSRLSRSWWYQDDLNILATVADRALTPGLLFSDYNGHLVPGSWAIAWVFDRIAPLAWWPAALLVLIMVAATDLMMLALLHRLFGSRPAILFPYAMFCFTSLVLTSTLWWAAALQWLPVSLSLVTALWAHVGYLRTRRRADAAIALLAVLFGLAFFEKALTTLIVLALFTVAYAVPGPLWRRPWRAFRTYWQYWLAHAALAGGYVGLYLTQVTIDTGAAAKTADIFTVTRLMILETLLPSLIGGPLNWYSTPESTIVSWPHPAPVLVVVAAVLTVAAVVGSLMAVRGAGRAWLILAAYLGISVALVVRARLGFIGPFIGRDHRYLTDLAVMAPLCLTLAWVPLREGLDAVLETAPSTERAQRRRERRDRIRARLSGRFRLPLSGGRRSGVKVAATVVALAVVIVGGIVSGEKYMKTWTTNPGEAYFDNLKADLTAHSGPVYLFSDAVVPDLVMTPTFEASRQLGWVTRPLKERPIVRDAVPYFSVVDPEGHLSDGIVSGADATITAPVCASSAGSATIPLTFPTGAARWKLRLGYYTNRQTTARVAIGTNPAVEMRLERGLHEVYVSLLGGGSTQIRLDGVDAGASVCIGSATLGLPMPKP